MESMKRSFPFSEDEAGPSPKVANTPMELELEENSTVEEETYDLFFEKVIGIDVIFDQLERSLAYTDLKSLRLVSKTCEQVVLKHKFLRKTKFIVRDKTIDSKVLDGLRFKPKHMKIEQFVGASMEELDLNVYPENDMRKLNEIAGLRITVEGVPIWSFDEMKPVLELCEEIHTMEIQGPPFSSVPTKRRRVFPPVRDLLAAAKLLKTLNLRCAVSVLDYQENLTEAKGRQMEEPTVAVERLILDGPCGSILRCIKGFERLTGIKIMMSIRLREDKENYSYNKRMSQIIFRHRRTLQGIELVSSGENKWIFTDLNLMRVFPKLEKFKTSFLPLESHFLITFLKSHFPRLAELTLEFNGGSDQKFPEELLKFLVESNSNKLSVLRLYHPASRTYQSSTRDWFKKHETTWSFRHLTSLKEFVLDLGHLGGVGIRLQDLPSSLKKVFISPCYEILDSLIPVLRNIHEVLKVLPELSHLELRGYRPYGRRDIVLTNLQSMKNKPDVARKLEDLNES